MWFCEPVSHEASVQLQEIEKMFDMINLFAGAHLSIVDLHAVIFDTTSSNTGLCVFIFNKSNGIMCVCVYCV